MKTISKKAILFIVILFSVLSCERDETQEQLISESEPSKQKLANVSSIDIPEVMNFLKQEGKTQLDFAIHRSGSDVNKSGNEDLVLTTLELDNIKKLTNSQGLSNYSFQLLFDNHQNLNSYTSIFNLVVKELSTGEHYSYIQEFRIENAWLLSNNLQTDMPSYTGFIVFYNTLGEFLINLELSNGTFVSYEETGKCDGSQDGSGTGSGSGGSAGGSGPGDGGSVPGTGGPGGGFGGPGLPFGWYCFHRGSYHAMPGDCNAEWEGGYWVIDKSLILKEKGKKLLKNGCVEAPEECFNSEQDPCECDANGQCVEENDEVPINDGFQINILLVTELNSLLDEGLLPSQVQAMGYYGDELFQQMIDFLNENSTSEAQNFIHAIAETIEEVGNEGVVEVDFDVNNYPGKDDGLPFEWWEDQNYMENNFTINGITPNSYELLLFAILPPPITLMHIENSNTALDRAVDLVNNGTLTGIADGKADAFRHGFWNALGTVEFGPELMKILADAHEMGEEGISVNMDLFNNNIGRIIGFNLDPFFESDNVVEQAILDAIDEGDLVYIVGGVLIPTNQ